MSPAARPRRGTSDCSPARVRPLGAGAAATSAALPLQTRPNRLGAGAAATSAALPCGVARFHFGTLRREIPLIPPPTAGAWPDRVAHKKIFFFLGGGACGRGRCPRRPALGAGRPTVVRRGYGRSARVRPRQARPSRVAPRDFTSESFRRVDMRRVGARSTRAALGAGRPTVARHGCGRSARVRPRQARPSRVASRDFTSERSDVKSRSSRPPRREHGQIAQRTGGGGLVVGADVPGGPPSARDV